MDRVEPENPIGYYENSIVPKDKNNRFLVLKTVIKNLKEEKLTGEEIPSSTMIFDDQHKYETTIISEEEEGSKLNNQSSLMEIPPLLTKNIWYLVEIPEDISSESNFVMEYQIKNQNYHVQLSKPIYLKNDPVPNVKQKINAYMFWGDGCPHCENAHSFFKTIAKKYESCYQLVDFEVWTNDKHVPLQKKVSKYFKANELGVPLIVIGDKHFAGYAESFNEEIIQALIEGCTSDNYVDIVSKIQNNK